MIFSGSSRHEGSRRGSGGSPHHHHPHLQQLQGSTAVHMAVAGIRKDLEDAIRLKIENGSRRPSDICSARGSSPAPNAADIEAFGQQILADFRRRSKSVEARRLSELAKQKGKSGSYRHLQEEAATASRRRRPSSAGGRQSSIVSTASSLSASLSPDTNNSAAHNPDAHDASAHGTPSKSQTSAGRKKSWLTKLFGSGTSSAPNRRPKAIASARRRPAARAHPKRRAQSEIRKPITVPDVEISACSPHGEGGALGEHTQTMVRSRSADDYLEPVASGVSDPGAHHMAMHLHSDKDNNPANDADLHAGRPTIKKNFNRFSNFVKSGAEAYVLSDIRSPLTPTQMAEVIETDEGPRWRPAPHGYDCVVDKPKKEKKFKGMKSFIAYQLTPSFNGIQVSRRYKHFDWLYERLCDKFVFTPLPPLPEKQVAGKFEEEVIEQRKHILQLWVSKICRHPVLSQADVWMHFLTCTDEKKWKEGKRKAEKDEYCGGSFFLSVKAPERAIDAKAVEASAERFSRGARLVDDAVRSVYHAAKEMAKSMSVVHKRDGERMGLAMDNLSLALSQAVDLQQASAQHHEDQDRRLTLAIKSVGGAFQTIGSACDEQARTNVEGLLAALYMYKGMLAQIPDMLAVQKSAQVKRAEYERLASDNKVSQNECNSVRTRAFDRVRDWRRVDTISYVCLAEMAHFERERVHDFKNSMTKFLGGQIAFYKKIVQELETSLNEFELV